MRGKQEVEAMVGEFSERLRASGQRVTQQRLDVYRELARSTEHPDADTVFRRVRRRLPSISLDTVYRTLAMLERDGFVMRVESVCDRVRYDADTRPHHHAVCNHCGAVLDFDSAALQGVSAPADIPGFAVVGTLHIEVRGVCERCFRKKSGR